MKSRPLQWAVGATLFAFFVVRLSLAALFKPFWVDEAYGLRGSTITSFRELLWHGSSMPEGNTSPLHFILDRLWMWLFNFQPQVYGDLRLLLRVPHVVFWAIAGVAVFVFVERLLARKTVYRLGVRLGVAAAISIFYHANTFASYYALETRAYSLWCCLITLYLLFSIWSLLFSLNRKQWFGFATVCVLLVFNAFATLGLVLGGMIVQLWFTPERRHWKRNVALAVLCSGISRWYLSKLQDSTYEPVPLSFGVGQMLEVVGKSLHCHSHFALVVSVLFFCFYMPFRMRNERLYQAFYLYVWGALGYCFVLLFTCWYRHYIVASRQFIFLVPYLAFAYALGLYQVMKWITQVLRRFPRLASVGFVHVLLLWSAQTLVSRLISDGRSIRHDLVKFSERHALSKTRAPGCPAYSDYPDWETMEKLNDVCRGF